MTPTEKIKPRAWFVKHYADVWIHFDNEVDAQAYRVTSGSALLVAYSPDALATSPASSGVEGEAVADGLIEFAKAMIRLSWEGCDADGGLIQETALKFGLLEQTVFDRTKHKDPQGFTEDGDWWYVFAGPLAARAPQTEGK